MIIIQRYPAMFLFIQTINVKLAKTTSNMKKVNLSWKVSSNMGTLSGVVEKPVLVMEMTCLGRLQKRSCANHTM